MITILPTTSGKPFCNVSSDDPMHSSNLQLFSLRQAFKYWQELCNQRSQLSSHEVTEFLVFITVCAGTSISQVIGQNATHTAGSTHVKSPKPLFDQVFGVTHLKREQFRTFIDVYDDCRHFGSPKYPSVASLTDSKCQSFLDLVVDLWDELVRKYIADSKDTDDKLVEFKTVRDFC